MVTDRLLVDLAADGRVSVTPWLQSELPGGATDGAAAELEWPLDSDALEELRWYLEDYLRAPFGVWQERGPQTAARLQPWGEAIFHAIFGAAPARDAYQRWRERATGLEVVFRSGSSRWLGLPWELMRDPADDLPLALGAAGMDRTLPTENLKASFVVPGGRLRVLMVISRPVGVADVGFQMIARPLLARLEAVRGNVELVVLRPPTLEALSAALAEARTSGEPFQIVHFDGHGVLDDGREAGTLGMHRDTSAEGMLVFEGSDGSADLISASRVAQVLAAAEVPVVVLNACQSGAVGKQLEAAVATRLLHGGAESVVAMAYRVYAVAAAEFMAAFYERLFAGDSISQAVTAGRRQLFRYDARPSAKGDLPLGDWVVPVHYLRRDVSFPGLITARRSADPQLEDALKQLRNPGRVDDGGVLAPVGAFSGRDNLLFDLETAARLQHVIVLHGSAGTGKTELAKAFGRWWADTGGVDQPGWVFWHSFEPGLASFGLAGAVSEIGLAVYGPGFSELNDDQRNAVVDQFLRERRALLLWDNFESVHTLPDPAAATPPLNDAGCLQLRGFLHRLAAGARSTVLLTSRTRETWLDDTSQDTAGRRTSADGLRRIRVAGLLPQEAARYASELLAPYPAAAPHRASRSFGDLMEWLDGHPLSMRLILPHLETTDPQILLEGLQGTSPLPGSAEEVPGRTASLSASLSYSFTHLHPGHQQLLVAVCLLQDVVDADVLATFSRMDSVPGRFAGVTRETWADALESATETGLLIAVGNGLCRIHPAFPAYLAGLWRDQEKASYESQRDAATTALLAAYAALSGWLSKQVASGDAGLAYTIIDLHQCTMGRLLCYALDHQQWSQASEIVEPLDDYWDARGLYAEAAAWTERVRLATEDATGQPPPLGSPGANLWLFLIGSQANRLMNSGNIDAAEQTYGQILTMLQSQPESDDQQGSLAVTYGQLGRVAQARGQLENAAGWYTRAIAISEKLGNRSSAATSYHQLGTVAQERGRLEEAEAWHTRSLPIFKQLGDRSGIAASYHQLGLVAQLRGRLEEAENRYTRSLAMREELGDRPGIAISYHELGAVAQLRGRLEEAEQWYTRSLAIKEKLGDRPGMAPTYHQLGMVAQERGRLKEAADWHTSSLLIKEELGDRPGMASSYHQLGRVAHERGQLYEAESWYTRSLAIKRELDDRPGLMLTYWQFGLLTEAWGNLPGALEWHARCLALSDQIPHLRSGPAQQLARLTHELGIGALEACWQRITGHPLPAAARDFARAYRPPVAEPQNEGGGGR
jgi:tetratricopeptide (TPR) repeat protein